VTLYDSTALEWRTVEGFPATAGASSRSLAWVRSPRAPLDKALLAMITDNSPSRAAYALGPSVMSTTLTLSVYLHATVAEIAEVGNDFLLVEYEGRVGGGGACDERSNYWSRGGKLLATGEQLAWYREPRPRE
jgi:acyl-CoA thioesterase